MKLRLLLFFVGCLLVQFVFSQEYKEDVVYINLEGDSLKEKDRASQLLRDLKNGAVVFRLKTNDKSVNAYRAAGKDNIADRIESERKEQNERFYYAFKQNFRFCPVFFIYAKDTKRFLEGDTTVLLNSKLEHDSSILFGYKNFIFCEYGSAEAYSKFTDVSSNSVSRPSISGGNYTGAGAHTFLDTTSRATTTSPSSTSALVFLDMDLTQLQRPFPYAEAVYFNNPTPAIRLLNNEIYRAYSRLVVMRDYKEKKKSLKKQLKQSQTQP